MNNTNRNKYKNIYYMLAYCPEELKYFNEALISYEKIGSTHELLAILLCKTFELLKYNGYFRDYDIKQINTNKPYGSIDLAHSIQTGIYMQGKISCKVYVLDTTNIYTQIIKKALLLLLKTNNKDADRINKETTTKLNKYLHTLSCVDTKSFNVRELNNIGYIPEYYKPVIFVSKLIINDWIAYDASGRYRLLELNNDDRFEYIWEKYVFRLIKDKRKHIQILEKPSYDFGIQRVNKKDKIKNVNGQPDIEIYNQVNNTVIVIDTKYYQSEKVASLHKYQIWAYVNKCYEKYNKTCKVIGILLYASDDDTYTMWEDMSDNKDLQCYAYKVCVNDYRDNMENNIMKVIDTYI